MPVKLIRFLVFAIAVLLPLQGVAAVMSAQCMAFGHHQQDAGGHDSHSHDETNGHDSHGHASHGDESGNSAHCGPCTACCASTSIAGPAPFAIAPSRSDVAYVFTQSPPPSVQLDGLDRPPLSL